MFTLCPFSRPTTYTFISLTKRFNVTANTLALTTFFLIVFISASKWIYYITSHTCDAKDKLFSFPTLALVIVTNFNGFANRHIKLLSGRSGVGQHARAQAGSFLLILILIPILILLLLLLLQQVASICLFLCLPVSLLSLSFTFYCRNSS